VVCLNFVSYYIIKLPLCVYLGVYRGMGFTGIWTAILGAQVLICLAQFWAVATADWEKARDKAKERNSE